ncbi:MAG: hypothetical protein U0136_16105 [Bdellovibrionota bacterium]
MRWRNFANPLAWFRGFISFTRRSMAARERERARSRDFFRCIEVGTKMLARRSTRNARNLSLAAVHGTTLTDLRASLDWLATHDLEIYELGQNLRCGALTHDELKLLRNIRRRFSMSKKIRRRLRRIERELLAEEPTSFFEAFVS